MAACSPSLRQHPQARLARAPLVDPDVHGQARLFEAILAFIHALSRGGPSVVIVDDLQWADSGTLELLQFLLRNSRGSRVLFVLLVRTDDLDAAGEMRHFLAELDRDAGVDRLELGPLDRAESRDLLAARGVASLTSDRLEDLTQRAGGNPFYLEQLATGSDGIADGDRPLTPGLREVLAARLADLPPRTRQVLRAAAAAGRRVDDEILAAVLEAPHAEVADALREAMSRRILVDADGIGGYAFRHALLREVAYDELLFGERDRLHAAFAEQLGRRGQVGGVAVTPAELAYHWDAARNVDRAIPAWIEAGLAAERIYAFADARRAFERALDLGPGADDVDWSEVLHRAADCALLTGDYRAAVELGRRAIASAASGPNADPVRAGTLQERMRWYLWEAGDGDAAAAAVAEAIRLIPESPPSRPRARALAHLAGLRLITGDAEGAVEPARQALAVARATDDGAGEAALALGILGWLTAAGGRVDEGLALFQQGLDIAEQLGGVEGIALGQTNLAALLDRVGRSEASLEAATVGFERLRELGVARTYGGILAGHAAKALFDLGRWSEAAARAEEGLDLDPLGPAAAWLHVVRARIDTNQGRPDDAVRHLATARSLMDGMSRSRSYLPALLGAEAELAASCGDPGAAWTVAEQALASVRSGGTLDPALGWVVWHVIRAEADAAELSGGPGSVSGPQAGRPALMELGIERIERGPAGGPRAARARCAVPRRARPVSGHAGPRRLGGGRRPVERAPATLPRRLCAIPGRGGAACVPWLAKRGDGRPPLRECDGHRARGHAARPRHHGPRRPCPDRSRERGRDGEREFGRARSRRRPRADRPRGGGHPTARHRAFEPGDRRRAVPDAQDGKRPRLEHPGQARRVEPRPGRSGRPAGRFGGRDDALGRQARTADQGLPCYADGVPLRPVL